MYNLAQFIVFNEHILTVIIFFFNIQMIKLNDDILGTRNEFYMKFVKKSRNKNLDKTNKKT